jgi:hypothetical protein
MEYPSNINYRNFTNSQIFKQLIKKLTMKKIIILFASSLFTVFSYGQTTHTCDTVYLKNETNIKNAEPCVNAAADYVLAHPLHGNKQIYNDYRGFILAWMDKTPDYTFSLNEKMMELCKEDDNILLFGVYTTCLAKAALKVKKEFNAEAIKLFANYIKNPENKVTQTSKVKKLIEDFNSNKIDKYIK